MKDRRKLGLEPLPATDPRHGTENGYNNLGCRCAPCTTAHNVYTLEGSHANGRTRPRDQYLADIYNPLTAPDDPRHGTAGAWAYHRCRCPICRAYAARTRREQRARKRAALAEAS